MMEEIEVVMEQGFYLTWDAVIKIAAILAAVGAIVTLLIKCVHWFDKQEKQTTDVNKLNKKHDEDIASIQNELEILTYGTLACLKGLHEKGCDGPVTEAIDKIEKYVNRKAHSQE